MGNPSTEEKQDIIIRMLLNIQKRLDKIEGKTEWWVNKEKAMEVTGYSSTKLLQEVKAGRIPVNQNPKRARQILYNVVKFRSGN